MRAMMRGSVTRLSSPSEGAACTFRRPSRHEFDHLVDNVGTAPVGAASALRGEG
jgi:hypothetical protein